MSLEHVDPNIGGIGRLLKATYPTVYRPHGMIGVTPQFDPAVGDRYLADHIYGFPVPVHLHRNSNSPLLMPVAGSPAPALGDCASTFDHDFETTAPHYYRVLLERYDIDAELTVTRHGVVYRFTFPKDQSPCLLLATQNAAILSADDTVVEGHQELTGNATGYFSMRFDRPTSSRDRLQSGLRFYFSGSTPIEVRIGVSLIDAAQARRNLENELGDRPFAQLVGEAQQEWEAALAQIRVEGGSERQRRIRQIMDVWFDDTPLGLCGDEDGGAMSAWHIFNSIGFLPTCPGEPYYALGSPVFERVELHPPGSPVFVLNAEGSSPQYKYIQRATLNGTPYERPWFPHEAIQNGGELTLEMGPRPNKTWVSRPADTPPSLSDASRSR